MPDLPIPIDDAALDAMIAGIADDPERQRSDYQRIASVRRYERDIRRLRQKIETECLKAEEAADEKEGSWAAYRAKQAWLQLRANVESLARRALDYREELNGGPPVELSGKPLPADCAAILRRYLPSSDRAADRRSSGPEAP